MHPRNTLVLVVKKEKAGCLIADEQVYRKEMLRELALDGAYEEVNC
jgi:hypothetical protein